MLPGMAPEIEADQGLQVAFEWVSADRDSAARAVAVIAEGMSLLVSDRATRTRRIQLVGEKLQSIGMAFDQQPPMQNNPEPSTRASSNGTAGQIYRAVDAFLTQAETGLVVDTSHRVVEIDGHPALSRGQLVLIQPIGASQLRSGSRRPLLDALQAAALRSLPLGFQPPPDLDRLRTEFANLPHTLEEFLATISTSGSTPALSYAQAGRLGALRRCDVCQTEIADVVELSRLLAEFYDAPDRRQHIADALVRSGLEVGDPLSPNYCSEHGQITPTSNQ